jgi:hypothetical protein
MGVEIVIVIIYAPLLMASIVVTLHEMFLPEQK